MAATAGLKRSTWPTISVTPARLRGGDDLAALLDRGRDRLLDQNVDAAGDAGERDFVMQMRRRGDGHGIDAFGEQLVEGRRRLRQPVNSVARARCAGQGIDDRRPA